MSEIKWENVSVSFYALGIDHCKKVCSQENLARFFVAVLFSPFSKTLTRIFRPYWRGATKLRIRNFSTPQKLQFSQPTETRPIPFESVGNFLADGLILVQIGWELWEIRLGNIGKK